MQKIVCSNSWSNVQHLIILSSEIFSLAAIKSTLKVSRTYINSFFNNTYFLRSLLSGCFFKFTLHKLFLTFAYCCLAIVFSLLKTYIFVTSIEIFVVHS